MNKLDAPVEATSPACLNVVDDGLRKGNTRHNVPGGDPATYLFFFQYRTHSVGNGLVLG